MWIVAFLVLLLMLGFRNFIKYILYMVAACFGIFLIFTFCPILMIPLLLWAAFGYLF